MKILLVEDDEIIARTLADILRDRYYVVDLADSGDLGWEMVGAYEYDLIVLDIELPKLNGIELCKKLRDAGNQTPILLLTAQNSSDKKVIGLDAGADDYVVKPFEITELLARIRVLIRRRDSLESPILQWGKLSLNSSTHEVTYDRQSLNLTPKEYRLLELFLRNSDRKAHPEGNRVLTREIILASLWDIEEAPNENTVTAHIKDLRRKLKQVGADANLIETVYGVGYRLKAQKMDTKSGLQNQTKNKYDGESKNNLAREIRQKTQSQLAKVWHKYEQTYNQRLAILERASSAWQVGELNGQLLQQAQWAAHKLAGGLGVFGFAQGSHLALEMEQLLKIELEKNRGKQFAKLLINLKNSLKPNFKSQLNCVNSNRPIILVVDDKPELVQQLVEEMTAIDTTYELVSQPASMKKALQVNFDVIVCEFSLAECSAKTLDNFALIINGKVPLPVILFTDRNRDNHQKIARLGSHILLQRASLDKQATKAIVKALRQSQHKTAQVLAVDDDPQILAAIDNLLDPLKINLTILDSSLNFWHTIDRLKPDLLILDVSMPHFSGIELCRLLRNDLRWRELPILFFTVHNDLDTVHQILTAGANDCISKVLNPTELVPKIFNHLNRGQLLASMVI